MSKLQLFLLVLSSVFISTVTYANGCTKDEVLRFIDSGFSKAEINELCNKTASTAKETTDDISELTQKLMTAMAFNPQTEERMGDSGEVIQSYIKAGYLGSKPNARSDYTDYWLFTKSVDFMGHRLMVIEEEYMGKWIGCCANPGIGITVKINTDVSALKNFAATSKCTFSTLDQAEFNSEMASVGVNTRESGKFATLSCRERDAND